MDIVADLQARKLIHDHTDLDFLRARLADGPLGVYVGFDPTADSLHVGHLLGQVTLRRFQLAGHRPIVLAGGATGMVGDPSGRSEERNLLDDATLAANLAGVSAQLERLLDFGPGPTGATLVNNATWTRDVPLLTFLRDVGKHFTINQMLAKDSVRSRLDGEGGLSFTEFSYSLLQANDFAWLAAHEGCELQMGGSDQWGNIVAGIDLIRRTQGRAVHGLTWPLLTKADGSKFGKTADGAVWLDPARTSPYQFRQFWFQADDAEVERYLLQFTLVPVEEIAGLMARHRERPAAREAQRRLASELTAMVHGPDAARAADEAAAVLFGGDPTAASPEVLEALAAEVPSSSLDALAGRSVVDLLVHAGLASSNGDARRTLDGNGASLNGARVGADHVVGPDDVLHGRFVLLRKGRSSYHLLRQP